MIDRVRKSSGGIIGVVRVPKDFAAFRSARSDAVRFDLKADLRGGDATSTSDLVSSLEGDFWKTLKSNSSTAISGVFSGWSSELPSGDESVRILRGGVDLFPRGIDVGVIREPREGESSIDSSPKEGIESLDNVLVDMTDSCPFSLFAVSSSSSGGLNKKSRGLFPNDILRSFSEPPVCRIIASTVNFCPDPLRVRPP